MAIGVTIGTSFGMGFLMIALTSLLIWLQTNFNTPFHSWKWIVLPVLGYLAAVGINSSIQYTSCSQMMVGSLFATSASVPIAIFLFLLLSSIGFVSSPIVSATPLAMRMQYGPMFAVMFYMFWAGMFGEGIAGGLSQICPSA